MHLYYLFESYILHMTASQLFLTYYIRIHLFPVVNVGVDVEFDTPVTFWYLARCLKGASNLSSNSSILVYPIITSLKIWKKLPCKGFVRKYVSLKCVGQYFISSYFLLTLSFIKIPYVHMSVITHAWVTTIYIHFNCALVVLIYYILVQ